MDFITKQKKELSRFERFVSSIMLAAENVVKIPLFRCQRCGECILSHTAFICSQRCPKRMRNGPCGGTRENGNCEVYPDRKCVWYRIHKRARFLHRMNFLYRIEKVHNWNLERTSAWLNVFTGRIEPPEFFLKKQNEPEKSDKI